MMEKNRQTKVIAIIALVVAIVGMSLGFAAFSNILTISSSATVTPNKEDFKITVYGLNEGVTSETFISNPLNLDIYSSKTTGSYVFGGTWNDSFPAESATLATIDNDNHTISNLSFTFTEPNQDGVYPFIIKNEGEYDAYLNTAEIEKFIQGVTPVSCQAGTGATESLVTEACDSIQLYINYMDSAGEGYEGGTTSYKLESKDHILVIISIMYSSGGARSDGPFTATFEDIKLNFSTVES